MKRLLMILTLLLMIGSAEARSQIASKISPAVQSGDAGETLTFSANLTNIGGPPLYLNGDSFSLQGTGLQVDDTKFFANTPAFLEGGESWSGELFDVKIELAALPGNYVGSFTILGGFDNISVDVLAKGNFQVTVGPQSVPEPSSAIVLTGIIMGSGLLCQHRLRRSRHCLVW